MVVRWIVGGKWKANKNQNLLISEPSYIGCRIAKISEIDYDQNSARKTSMILSPLSKGKNKSLFMPIVIVEEVPPEELRKAFKLRQNTE